MLEPLGVVAINACAATQPPTLLQWEYPSCAIMVRRSVPTRDFPLLFLRLASSGPLLQSPSKPSC